MTEQDIQDAAIRHAKSIKKSFARRITDKQRYPAEAEPVSVFVAGSPGAGKTEASKALLEQFDGEVIRIDADDYRDEFKDQGLRRRQFLVVPGSGIDSGRKGL